mgnify:FL=1
MYEEISWFYPKANSTAVDRVVTYNYTENTWTTGSLSRTTWFDATLYDNPYASEFIGTGTPSFPTILGVSAANGASTYYAHEVGNDQVDFAGTPTAIPAFIESGDFDLGEGDAYQFISKVIPDIKFTLVPNG